MLVVMMLMTASSAMAQEAKFEVISGLRYLLDTGAKTATLMPKTDSKYSGDIIIPEKVKGNDGVEYVVTSLGDGCFGSCSALTSITIPSSVTSLGERCFYGCSGLETVSFKGKVSKNTSQSEIPTTTIIKVPIEYLQDYKDAIGYFCYATADGYSASDKAEATLYWINANLDNGTNINQVRTRGVVASAHDGIISLSGLDDGEVVKFFAADGKSLGSTVAANGAASYAVSESLVIAKVGKDSIKIAMK